MTTKSYMVRLDLPCSPFRDFLDLIITMFSWYNIVNFTQGREKLEADRQTQAGPGCHEKDTILPGNEYAFTPEANWNRLSEVFI